MSIVKSNPSIQAEEEIALLFRHKRKIISVYHKTFVQRRTQVHKVCFGHENIDTMWFDVVRPPEVMTLKRIRSVSALRSYSSALTSFRWRK